MNSQFLRPRPPKRRCPHLLHQLLDIVVVDRHAAVVQVQTQRVPMIAEIAQGLGDFLFRQDALRRVPVEQFSQAFPDRLGITLAQSLTLGGRQTAGSVFDVV